MLRLLKVSCACLSKTPHFIYGMNPHKKALLSFEALKKALLSSLVLCRYDYTKDFILYLVTSDSIADIVLVQEYDKF